MARSTAPLMEVVCCAAIDSQTPSAGVILPDISPFATWEERPGKDVKKGGTKWLNTGGSLIIRLKAQRQTFPTINDLIAHGYADSLFGQSAIHTDTHRHTHTHTHVRVHFTQAHSACCLACPLPCSAKWFLKHVWSAPISGSAEMFDLVVEAIFSPSLFNDVYLLSRFLWALRLFSVRSTYGPYLPQSFVDLVSSLLAAYTHSHSSVALLVEKHLINALTVKCLTYSDLLWTALTIVFML